MLHLLHAMLLSVGVFGWLIITIEIGRKIRRILRWWQFGFFCMMSIMVILNTLTSALEAWTTYLGK